MCNENMLVAAMQPLYAAGFTEPQFDTINSFCKMFGKPESEDDLGQGFERKVAGLGWALGLSHSTESIMHEYVWQYVMLKLGFEFAELAEPIPPEIPPESIPRPGYIYILKNRAMPGLLKIGMTKHDPSVRVSALSKQTAVPAPFEIVWSGYVTGDRYECEADVHDILRDVRCGKKEFFMVSEDYAINLCKDMMELNQ